jgi:hypothetical protein
VPIAEITLAPAPATTTDAATEEPVQDGAETPATEDTPAAG